MIPKKDLISIFQRMYQEHWSYRWGASEEGCVDCSGAFVYAYRQFGEKIAHGSNSIGHKYVGELLPLSKAEPGMAAFKVRPWTEDQKGNAWYGSEPGDIHHVGLVDEDTGYVLNAKGTNYGFCRDKLAEKSGWDYVAYLSAVEYSGGGGGGGDTPVMVTVSGGNPNAPINMRDKPGGKLVEQIPQGATAELLSEEGDWDKLKYSGKVGYVMAMFVHKGDTPTPDPTGETVTVPKEDLRGIYDQLEKICDQLGNWLGLRG